MQAIIFSSAKIKNLIKKNNKNGKIPTNITTMLSKLLELLIIDILT